MRGGEGGGEGEGGTQEQLSSHLADNWGLRMSIHWTCHFGIRMVV